MQKRFTRQVTTFVFPSVKSKGRVPLRASVLSRDSLNSLIGVRLCHIGPKGIAETFFCAVFLLLPVPGFGLIVLVKAFFGTEGCYLVTDFVGAGVVRSMGFADDIPAASVCGFFNVQARPVILSAVKLFRLISFVEGLNLSRGQPVFSSCNQRPRTIAQVTADLEELRRGRETTVVNLSGGCIF